MAGGKGALGPVRVEGCAALRAPRAVRAPAVAVGLPESGWLVVSLLTEAAEFSTGVTELIAYLRTHQGSNKSDIAG